MCADFDLIEQEYRVCVQILDLIEREYRVHMCVDSYVCHGVPLTHHPVMHFLYAAENLARSVPGYQQYYQ